MRCADLNVDDLSALLDPFGLHLVMVPSDAPIPGSFWGEDEAGLQGRQVLVRQDTPVHSLLHEACHAICMDPQRRQALDTDAGGDEPEENATCYLQSLLADWLPGYSRARLHHDMDAWGYSFRLGSAARWFREDADDARRWLRHHGLVDGHDRPTGRVRNHP